jgi:hypothetical protein
MVREGDKVVTLIYVKARFQLTFKISIKCTLTSTRFIKKNNSKFS